MSVATSVSKFLNNPTNTLIGTCSACMIARPLITLSNKSIPDDTRKYTATTQACTELFGLATIFTFANFMEKFSTRATFKRLGAKYSKELVDTIKDTNFKNLANIPQNLAGKLDVKALTKIKNASFLGSFIGTAISVAVLTPILNNMFVGKVVDKISGKNKASASKPLNADTPKLSILSQKDSFTKFNALRANTAK